MNWLLIVVIAIIAICGIMGFRKGLVRVLFSLATAVLSIVLVSFVEPYVGTALKEHTGLHAYIKEKSTAMVAEWNPGGGGTSQEERILEIDGYEIPDVLKDYLKTGYTEESLQMEFTDYLSSRIADMVVRAAAFLVAFIVIALALRIVAGVLDIIVKLPVLNTLNHAGGLVAGLAEGLLLVWLFFLAIMLLYTTSFGKECMRLIEGDGILSMLYRLNPLMRMFV